MQLSSHLSLIVINKFSRYKSSETENVICVSFKMPLIVPVQALDKKVFAINQWKNQKNLKVRDEKRQNFILTTWKTFCKQTSIHAMHYLSEASITLIEKALWAFAISFATAVMVYSCMMLSDRFRSNLLSTVFESTNFKVSEIPFAAVTVCNNNRLDYSKTEDAITKFMANRSKTETETFVKFLKILQNMDYGSFDEFEMVAGSDVAEMDKLNITEVYEFMMHDCEDFFISCWWRNTAFNCCEWFSKQRSEYGICWSFNSYTNVGSNFINVRFSSEISLSLSIKPCSDLHIFHGEYQITVRKVL